MQHGRAWPAVLLLALVTMMVAPAGAGALTYEQSTFACGGQRGGGSTDATGRLYVACWHAGGAAYQPNVLVLRADGSVQQRVFLNSYATDVAPSPDGSSIYAFRNQTKEVERWQRRLDGSYVRDPNWQLAAYPMWGTMYRPRGEFLDTDDAGFIYVSAGTWTDAPTRMLKYRPDGSLVTGFGDWAEGWTPGLFYWNATGLAASADGSRVYVAEVGNNRIQRFDRQADGSYRIGRVFGNDPAIDEDPRSGWCGDDVRPWRIAAPYDVGLDSQGRIHVLNTTCGQVKVFTAGGDHLATVQVTPIGGQRIHGMAVAASGTVYLPEVGRVLRPRAGAVAPAPQPVEQQRVPITEQHTGWARAHATAPAQAIGAWRWTAAGWQRATLPHRRWIWMHPFAPGWMWAWTEGDWYAVRPQDVSAR